LGAVQSNSVRQQPARYLAGLRLSALIEISLFIVSVLLADQILGAQDRFSSAFIHPFWIVVVLSSSYYGTREGLVAAVISSFAFLIGNFPIQRVDELGDAWLMRAMLLPVLWCLAALLLGFLADALRDREKRLQIELSEVQEQLQTITHAYESLQTANQHLQVRVAAQVCTVNAMYQASRAIDRNGVGEVLVGVNDLVRQVLNPEKFSLYLLSDAQLEAVANEGWTQEEGYLGEFDAQSALYDAVIVQRRFLTLTDRFDAITLGHEGLLAGPLINDETGRVVGMLKIEAIGFLDLNWSTIQNFRIVCNWVGGALANAQRYESKVMDLKQ
jgi:polysaccharide biosynthesis protein PelD